MAQIIVANDVPHWLLDIFERLAYDQINVFVMPVFVGKLKDFCRRYPQKSADYAAGHAVRDIPQRVADVLSAIDYGRINPTVLASMQTSIPNYLEEHLSWAMKGR